MNEETVRGPLEHPVGRWFVLNRYGVPMLCADEDDARKEAAANDRLPPRKAPHRAAYLVPADDLERLRAENERLREALAIFVHAHRSGNAVPPHIEAEAKKLLTPNAVLSRRRKASFG